MKKALTWIRASAEQIHIWNYFWAVKPMVDFQNSWDYEIVCFIADMHSLNTVYDKVQMENNVFSVLKSYIACWLDPNKITIFRQSSLPEHSQLAWILWCITTLWFMKRMHTYKDALDKWTSDEINMWVFSYPVLMAADILLYDTDIVPVWKDQKQHVEFARDIAWRFNNLFWEAFKLPEPYIQKEVATVPWIDWRKMSKSYNNYIWIFEDEKTILKKVKSIVTDNIPVEDPKDPDKCNVFNIIRLFLNEAENKELRERYMKWWLKFSDVKMYLNEKVQEFVKPIQEKERKISQDYLRDVLKHWAIKWKALASKKIQEVYEKVGYWI